MPMPARSAGELNTQYRAKMKGASVDKEAAALILDALEKPKDSGKSLFQTKIKSRLAEVAALGRGSVSDSERAFISSASETSEKDDTVPSIQSIPIQLIRMVPAAAVSAATMQRAVSHATLSNLTRITASASSRSGRPRSNSTEALVEEEVSYRPLQPYSFPTGSIQPSQSGRHESGEQHAGGSHPHLASASSRLDRLRLQVIPRRIFLPPSLAAKRDAVLYSACCTPWKGLLTTNRVRRAWTRWRLRVCRICRRRCRRRSAVPPIIPTHRECRVRLTRILRKRRRSQLLHPKPSPVPCPSSLSSGCSLTIMIFAAHACAHEATLAGGYGRGSASTKQVFWITQTYIYYRYPIRYACIHVHTHQRCAAHVSGCLVNFSYFQDSDG